jgi:hypothetical protein
MPEQENTSSNLDSRSRDVALQILEAARDSDSLAEFLRASNIEPLDQLDDEMREQLGRGTEVEHTPIIITDGSVRMNLSADEYTLAASIYTSSGLVLEQVESTVGSHSNGSNVCYAVRNRNEVCTVVFHCGPEAGSSGVERIVIQGGLLMSPIISFDDGTFGEVSNPPPKRKIHRSLDRRINALEIFSTLNGVTRREHLCPLAGDGCEYQIVDPHR